MYENKTIKQNVFLKKIKSIKIYVPSKGSFTCIIIKEGRRGGGEERGRGV